MAQRRRFDEEFKRKAAGLRRDLGAKVSEAMALERCSSNVPACEAALCVRGFMHFPFDQQIELFTGVAKLTRPVVVINRSLDSPSQRFPRQLQRGDHQPSANFPMDNADTRRPLQTAGSREVKRHRRISLISAAVHSVAEKMPVSTDTACHQGVA